MGLATATNPTLPRRDSDDDRKSPSKLLDKLLRRQSCPPSRKADQDVPSDAPHSLSPHQLGSFEKALMRIRMSIGLRMYGARGVGVLRIDRRTMLKFRSAICLTEVLTMEHVRKHTTIPVPRIYDVFYGPFGRLCYTMDYIDAPELTSVWPTITLERRLAIVHELRGHLAQLRSLAPPRPGAIEAIDGSGCIEPRLRSEPIGPLDSVAALHTLLGLDWVLEHKTEEYAKETEALRRCASRASEGAYRTVLTHGDFAPRNILVDPHTHRIVSIIDWECAGWYSEYWEFTRGFSLNLVDPSFYQALVDEEAYGKTYSDELVMGQVLNGVSVRC
jgi:hypothetical protein